MLEAVIFDVDGTLLDTERIYMRAWKEAGRLAGYEISDEVLQKTRGLSVQAEIPIFQRACGADFPFDAVRIERSRLAEVWISNERNLQKPGAAEVLTFLRERHIPMAVASATGLEKTKAHLDCAGLLPFFSAVVGGDMAVRKKPDPEPFLLAASLLGVKPAHCLVVEDSAPGVLSGHAAGLQVVLIPDLAPPDAETASLAMAVLDRLGQLPPLLETLL